MGSCRLRRTENLVLGAELHDAARVKDKDLVDGGNRAGPVCHDDNDAALLADRKDGVGQ